MEVYTLSDAQYELVLAYLRDNGLSGGTTIFVDQAPDGRVYVTAGDGAPATGPTNQASPKAKPAVGDYLSTTMKPGASPELTGGTTNSTLSIIFNVMGIVSGCVYVVWQITTLVFAIQDRNDARRRNRSNNDDRASI